MLNLISEIGFPYAVGFILKSLKLVEYLSCFRLLFPNHHPGLLLT